MHHSRTTGTAEGLKSSSGSESRWATRKDWGAHRSTIERLYIHEGKPLKDVKATMEREYGFYATDKMYKSRLKSWNFEKNLRRDEVLAMMRVKTRRDAVGRTAEFWRNGKLVSDEMLANYLRFNKRVATEIRTLVASDPSSPGPIEALLPPHITVLSPMSPLEYDVQLHCTEGMLNSFRGYIDGSFAAGTWRIGEWRNWHSTVGGSFHGTLEFRAYVFVAMMMINEGHQHRTTFLNASFAAIRPIVLTQNPNLIVEMTMLYFEMEWTYKRPEIARVFIDYVARVCHQSLGVKHPLTTWFKGLARLKDDKLATVELLMRTLQNQMREISGHNQNVTHALIHYSKLGTIMDSDFVHKEIENLDNEIEALAMSEIDHSMVLCGLGRYRIMRLKDAERYQEAYEAIQQWIEERPEEEPFLQDWLGHIYAGLGRRVDSAEAFAKSLGWTRGLGNPEPCESPTISEIRSQYRSIDALRQRGFDDAADKLLEVRDQTIEKAIGNLRVEVLLPLHEDT